MLDEETRIFYVGEAKIKLTSLESFVLGTLIMNKYRVIRTRELAVMTYGFYNLDESSIDSIRQVLGLLRKKFQGIMQITNDRTYGIRIRYIGE